MKACDCPFYRGSSISGELHLNLFLIVPTQERKFFC